MKKLPIGISDFEDMITGNYFFTDKTLFIKEIVDIGSKVTLIPRPRRFGKTLNMTMLKCFFEISKKDEKAYLFKELKISKEKECMQHQGQYPVIFILLRQKTPCFLKLGMNGK